MRLHRLEVTAFGPFADPCVVDFDALTDGGLFLVHGPTGAGKTSLLDAVCFALYAGVPGGRGVGPGAQLRSHHAPENVAPRVVLDLTAAGRRLRITRSPTWSKPSRTNPVPAKVALEELRGGRWEPVSSRADEVGDVINDVIGMGRHQFERVVLLPQGDFAAFLRSNAEDRRKVLDRLFDVSTYGGVETWLADRRRVGAALLADRRAQIGRLTSALAEVVAGVPEPPSTGPDDGPDDGPGRLLALVGPAVDPDLLADLLPAVEQQLNSAVTTALAEHDDADGVATVAAEAFEDARLLLSTRDKGERARIERAGLAEAEVRLTPARLVVVDAERAAPLRGHLEAGARAAADQAEAGAAADVLLDELSQVGLLVRRGALTAPAASDLGHPSDDRRRVAADVRRLHTGLAGSDDPVAAASRALEDLERLQQRDTALLVQAEAARSQVMALQVAADAAEAALTDLAERREAAGAVAGGLSAAQAAHSDLSRRHALRGAVREGVVAIAAAGDALREAVDDDQSAKDTVIGLRMARLDDMAAELAGQLADGEPCGVCGSADHPRPATGRHTVTAEDVAAAERLSNDLSTVRASREGLLATMQGAQAERLAALGDDPRDEEVLALALAQAGRRVRAATKAGQDAIGLDSALVTTRAVLVDARSAREEMAARVLAADAASAELGRQASDTTDRLAAAVKEHAQGCPCAAADDVAVSVRSRSADRVRDAGRVRDADTDTPGPFLSPERETLTVTVVQRHHAVARLVGRATQAMGALDQLSADRAAAEDALADELATAGFQDAATAAAALVDRDRLGALVAELRQHDDAVVRVEAILADADIVTALAAPAPDLVAAQAWAGQAREAARAALRRHTEARTALDSGRRLIGQLSTAAAEFVPAAQRQQLLAEVADAATGNGSNTLRMPLSSYVLAARLERVVELANERLAVLGEGRFELRHTDDRSGNAKSGLGLEVVDLWTGMPRATSTLSGGESFMASLALALGLADAVREEAGGVDLQTLFVDEGFGTLDDESLEQVMAVLDTLRDGGRAVGVVSHVADLRTRIPRQVKVTKTPHGSSVSLVGVDRTDVA